MRGLWESALHNFSCELTFNVTAIFALDVCSDKKLVHKCSIYFGKAGVVVITDGDSGKYQAVLVDDKSGSGERVLEEIHYAVGTFFEK